MMDITDSIGSFETSAQDHQTNGAPKTSADLEELDDMELLVYSDSDESVGKTVKPVLSSVKLMERIDEGECPHNLALN